MVCHMSKPHAETVAAEARAALARCKITQTALAEATGRSQAYWSKRLTGAQAMTVDDLAAVAELAGVDIGSLLPAA
jgi:transcriptional regulator with XRE-family HTH domain